MMKEYDTYLFDFDGTLFDTLVSLVPVFRYAFQQVGLDCTPEEAISFCHGSLTHSAERKHMDMSKFPEYVQAINKGLTLRESRDLVKLFDDTVSVLTELKKRNKSIGIVSGNCEFHMKELIHEKGLDGIFDVIVGNDSYTKPKPDREPIDVALNKLGCSKSCKAVYVGDSLQDAACGVNAGIDGILVDRDDQHPDFEGLKISKLTELINY